MKSNGGLLACVYFASILALHAQGTFQNLDFESAKPTGIGIFGNPVDQALPGWQVYLNGVPANSIGYDTRTIDLWSVILQDGLNSQYNVQPISGKYSVFVGSGRRGFPDNATGPAAIAQTGTVPSDANSLLFAATPTYGNLTVSFNGQALVAYPFQDHGTYGTYGADISAFDGQTGELRFTMQYPSGALFDDIQFSSVVVPEPRALAMLTTGGLLLIAAKRLKAGATN